MAVGLGMTPEECEDLKSQVNDSFWVMRIIGMLLTTNIVHQRLIPCSGYPPLPNDFEGFSCGAHK